MTSPKPYILLLIVMYGAGLIGLNILQTTSLFQFLTPFNLLVSLTILLFFHKHWNRHFVIFVVVTFLAGFFIEVAGVKTGAIFGIYQYETTLGYKIFEVPVLIGANWFLLVYCVGSSFSSTALPVYTKVIYGALTLTVLDFLIEPVAVKMNMWTWKALEPPMQNYVAWFIVSAVLLNLFFGLKFRKDNPIALWLLILHICFFGIQNLMF